MKRYVYTKSIRCIFGRDTVRRRQKLDIAPYLLKRTYCKDLFIENMYCEYRFIRKYKI